MSPKATRTTRADKATRLFVQVRLIEELDLAPGKARPYKAYRTLDRRDLVTVPTIEDGEGWLAHLEDIAADAAAFDVDAEYEAMLRVRREQAQ